MSAKLKLRILDRDGQAVYDGPLIRLALRDEAVRAKSMEFFQDPEPCMLHRSAVMSRLYGEIMEYFDICSMYGRQSIMLGETPEWLAWYLVLPQAAASFEL